ncbi:MAG: peptidoglycan DD-metalloendopeptidase family protein [bacterium]|jgi:murein DD-endopeptidase MepM/ murein hydrolase activator NlpD
MTADNQQKMLPGRINAKKQLFLLPALLVLVAFTLFSFQNFGSIYAVEVNGEVIGYVRDAEGVRAAATAILNEQSSELGRQVTFGDSLVLKKVTKPGGPLKEPEELIDVLKERLPLTVPGCLVRIDGCDVVAVTTREEGAAVFAAVKADYADRIAGDSNTVFDEISIAETVEICEADVPLALLKTPEEAKQYLLTGTTEIKTHVVTKGDTLWTIAAANGVGVSELIEANPGINPNRLSIDQELNMIVPKPYINICSREHVIVAESIPFREEVTKDSTLWAWERNITQYGVFGQKEVVYAVSRRNGQVTDKQTVRQQVIKEPVTQLVVQGTKQDTAELAQGSGKFLWPAVGQITSYFGVRRVSRGSSTHTGIDIGMPYGTPVKAADDGVVTKACFDGGYGRMVIINHGNGYSTLYAHNQTLKVSAGDVVTRGQVIALSGSSGNSTGPHLHFEIRYNDKPQNPLNYFK